MSEILGFDETLLRIGSLAALAVSLTLSAFVLRRFGGDSPVVAGMRERFVFGVPWGTVIVLLSVYAMYYLLQGGGQDGGPIVTGFRSWSLWYPQGILLSSFAHSSVSHLMGNLFGALAVAPIAEYAWRHYPDERRESTTGWRGNPYARIGVFVGAVVGIGILGSVIVPGAVIGFSGLVFAFAGFALLTVPIATLLSILGIQVVRLLHRSLTDPLLIARSQEQFVRPSWADIAVQGHLYGLLVGVLLAGALLRYRNEDPNVYHVFFAALVFAVTRSLQSIYWFLGGETYVLFRALGAAGVFLLATLITLAALKTDRLLVPQIDLRVPTAAVGVLVALVLALALIGIPYNLVSVDGGTVGENGTQVEDYTVTYAENVEDRYIAAIGLPFYESPSVNQSGVIVTSDRRNSWEVATSAQQLESEGSSTVVVGDVTWRETVEIQRTTWKLGESNTTYKVFARHKEEWQRLFAADPARAEPIINGTNITIRPAEEFYDIVLTENGTQVGVEKVPVDDEPVTVADITFERDGAKLYATHERTRVRIGEFEF